MQSTFLRLRSQATVAVRQYCFSLDGITISLPIASAFTFDLIAMLLNLAAFADSHLTGVDRYRGGSFMLTGDKGDCRCVSMKKR